MKDAITSTLIPDVVSECSLVRDGNMKGTCLSDRAVEYLAEKVNINITGMGDEEAMKEIHKRYGTVSDRGLLEQLPPEMGEYEKINLKIEGPNGTELLSNYDIDGILKQWEAAYDGFFAYNFNMLDYTQHSFKNGRVTDEPDTLASIDPIELFKKYDCAACIVNSDLYKNPGKHWMAIFVDARGDEASAEFFNSSGNAPRPEWISYLDRAAAAIEAVKKKKCRIINNQLVQQYSRTECGVYSLFYIWARLNNLPQEYFDKNQVYDLMMFEFRAHLFEGYEVSTDGKWSFEQFKKKAHIKWDRPGGHVEP